MVVFTVGNFLSVLLAFNMASIFAILIVPDLIATAYFWFIPFLLNALDIVNMAVPIFGLILIFREPLEPTMEWFVKNTIDLMDAFGEWINENLTG